MSIPAKKLKLNLLSYFLLSMLLLAGLDMDIEGFIDMSYSENPYTG